MTTRRDVLRGALAGMALGSLPGWLATAVAGVGVTQDGLAAAFRTAAERGRPLLVVVVPDEASGDGWDRGRAWGAVLNHGGDAPLSALAMAHVVCGTLADLAVLLPQGVPDDAWAVRIDTDQVPATHAVFAGASPGRRESAEPWSEGWREEEERIVDAQIAWLGAGLQELLLADATLLARYAVLEEQRASGEVQVLAARLGREEDVPVSLVARFPATVALAATRHPRARIPWAGRLAQAARAEWVEERVPGSWWAVSHGCGIDFEHTEEVVRVACGMGYVPTRAARMLHFYGPSTPW